MFETISFSSCQTESSSHGTIFLIEDLKKAIEAKDLPFIFELKQQKAHWDWDDLIDVFNDCLYPLIEKNESNSNAFVIAASQLLFSDISSRDSFLDYLLQVACGSGNIELTLGLKDLCSEWWESLETEELAFAMDCLFHSMPEGQNPETIQAGKKEIYYFMTSHFNWAPDSDTLPDLFPYLLNPDKMIVEKEELNQLACAFLKVQSLEKVGVGLLAEVAKVVIRKGHGDFLKVLTSLPNWSKIPPYSYASILEQLFDHSNPDELDFFLAHPSWPKIPPNALRKLAKQFRNCGRIMLLLAKNNRWNELSAEDLIRISTPPIWISLEAIDLITSHPAWNQMNREDLADLIGSIGNSLSENNWTFFLKTTMHPRWEELTRKELSEIQYWLEPYGELREKFLAKLKEHKNWTE